MKLGAIVVMTVLICLPAAAADEARIGSRTILEQTVNLRPEVLELAIEAFDQAQAAGHVRRPVLTIIDYELPSFEKRLWVIDMEGGRVLFQEWVAHGMGRPRGSGGDMEEALSFSNERGTLKSSLGLFITAETYIGKHGYSLKLDGLEEGVNDNARERLIVLHSAQYVSSDRAEKHLIGRSWGCPAVRPEIAKELIDRIKDGSVLWVYYPHDEWLEESGFLD
ncbi:MAG: murein L,D-transpeptidase catalytic domain family protein [Thermoanaerobaculales bacterium]